MSSVYEQQPSTSGKVILVTTHGQIEIQLWCKEIPKATRNFIQLCLEGYYDKTKFHRLLPGFMIQGGDPTGTGVGGQSIYGELFKDQFHQRLKFSHRGIVAMANPDKVNSNGSQFFITFDQCSWLDNKHTIFGKIVGDTLYNFLEWQSINTDSNDIPIDGPEIQTTKVILNPFEDIVLRNNIGKVVKSAEGNIVVKTGQVVQGKPKPVAIQQQTQLLSFADQDEGVEKQEVETKQTDKKQILSSHDVLDSQHLSQETLVNINQIQEKRQQKEQERSQLMNLKDSIQNANRRKDGEDISKKKQRENLQNIMIDSKNTDLAGYKTRINPETNKPQIYWDENEGSENSSSSSSSSDSSTDSEQYLDEKEQEQRQKQKQEYQNLKIDFLQLKQNKFGTNNAEINQLKKQDNKLLSNLEKRKMKFIEANQQQQHEEDILQRLDKFRKVLYSSDVQQDQEHWMNHKLKFHIDSTRAFSTFENKQKTKDYKREDDTYVIDKQLRLNQAPEEESEIHKKLSEI